MKITKVYTRTGDDCTTSLMAGVRVRKSDIRVEAYGTVDELSSHLGLLAAMIEKDDEYSTIIRIQNNLFIIGTNLATDQSSTPLATYAILPNGEIELLEQKIDNIMAALPEPQGFVLPGGAMAAAQCHVCRTVCRRAERRIASLAGSAVVDADVLKYINRLSDYLFVLAKKINFNTGHSEILWENTCR